jgi:hypothetical protein
MQTSKNKAINQPKYMKSFRGRSAIKKFYESHVVDIDAIREKYY